MSLGKWVGNNIVEKGAIEPNLGYFSRLSPTLRLVKIVESVAEVALIAVFRLISSSFRYL